MTTLTTERSTTGNSTYKKLAVQWLHEALCFGSSSVVADSLVLRKRQLLVAAKRYAQGQIAARQKHACSADNIVIMCQKKYTLRIQFCTPSIDNNVNAQTDICAIDKLPELSIFIFQKNDYCFKLRRNLPALAKVI